MVTCCSTHRCRLLEACWRCGELIPLFTAPFTLGNCPRCRHALNLCAAASEVAEAELEIHTHVHDDIVFLLTPHVWEADSASIIKRVGRRLCQIRQTKRLTAVEVASQIGVSLTVVEGIERGDFLGRGATLRCYFKYAHHLSPGLKELFSDVIDAPDRVSATILPLCPACQQNDFVTRYGYNRSGSRRYQCHYCHRSFTASQKSLRGEETPTIN